MTKTENWTGELLDKYPLNALVGDDFDAYLDAPALQSSTIKDAITSLRHYHFFKAVKRKSSAMELGTMIHCAIITPELFGSTYVVFDPDQRPSPEQTFNAKVNKEWKERIYSEAEANGQILIDKEDYANFETLMDCYMASEWPQHFDDQDLVSTFREVSLYTPLSCGYIFKSRFDFLQIVHNEDGEITKAIITDLKTTDDAHPSAFLRDIDKFRYDIQDYTQIMALSSILPETVEVERKILALSKKPPFGIQDYYITVSARAQAKQDFEVALQSIIDYHEGNIAVPSSYIAMPVPYEVPAWKKKVNVDPF